MYKVYRINPDNDYVGFALVAAEDVTNANEIIQDFKTFDDDNTYNSYGYCFVDDDDLIEGLSSNIKGFILEEIYYHPY